MVTLQRVVEGETKLIVPKTTSSRTVFYNPRMGYDRDLSVKLLAQHLQKHATVLDLLCASGARGIRYAKEAKLNVCLNDASPTSIKLAKKNVKLNKVKASFSCSDANRFLLEPRDFKFDCIDIDPYGSPVPFLGNAFRALKPEGMLCCTATDLGTLSGAFAEACFRRYGITSARTSFALELAVRNLVFAIWKKAAEHDFSIVPLYAYAREHYTRAFTKVVRSTRADLDNIGFVSYCRKCENRKVTRISEVAGSSCSFCRSRMILLGPTWVGALGESTQAPFYFDLHALAQKHKHSVPKTDDVVKKLRAKGFSAGKSVFCSHGVATDAVLNDVLRAFG